MSWNRAKQGHRHYHLPKDAGARVVVKVVASPAAIGFARGGSDALDVSAPFGRLTTSASLRAAAQAAARSPDCRASDPRLPRRLIVALMRMVQRTVTPRAPRFMLSDEM